MKNLRRISLLALTLLFVLGIFFACGDHTTDGESTVGATTVAGTEAPEGSATVYELSSKTTSATIELRDGQPYIVSLKTESGVEKAGEPIPFSLPTLGRNVLWTHTATDEYDDGEGAVGYVFRFKNDDKQVTYDLYAVAHPDMAGPFQFFGTVTNNGSDTYHLFSPRSYFSMSIDGEAAPTAWVFSKESGIAEGCQCVKYSDPEIYGHLFDKPGIYQTVLEDKKTAVARTNTNYVWNENGDLPIMYLDYGTNGVYFAHEWSHAGLEAEGTPDGGAVLTAYLGDSANSFKSKIDGNGGTFLMPLVYLGVYDGDVDDGSNVFKHWFFRYKAPDNMYENPAEPLIQQDMQLGLDVSQYGIEAIKWDYGWWNDGSEHAVSAAVCHGPEILSPAYLGVMASYGCDTLADFALKAKERDLTLTMYFLLRDSKDESGRYPSSLGPNAHPEWYSSLSWHDAPVAADLGNADCVKAYQSYMYDFFSSNHITTWRSDFEPILQQAGVAQENRHYGEGGLGNGSDIAYWNTVGFAELVDHLLENIEGFRYESCSQGGSMKDLFTATKASIINCDDSSDFWSLHMSFYDGSYCLHPAQIQLPTDALTFTPGSPYFNNIGDYEYGFRCTLTGGVMLSNWQGTSELDKEYWNKYITDIYPNVMRPLIRNGNLYHILPRPDGIHWDGLQYVDLDSENEIMGMIMLWKPTNEEGEQKTIKLRGLDPEDSYQLTFMDRPEQNAVYTGAQLMEGLTVTIEGDFGSEIIWISHAE